MTPYEKKKAIMKSWINLRLWSVVIFFSIMLYFWSKDWPPYPYKTYFFLVPTFIFIYWVIFANNHAWRGEWDHDCSNCGQAAIEPSQWDGLAKFHDICPKCGNDNRVE